MPFGLRCAVDPAVAGAGHRSIIVVIGYSAAFFCLSQALKRGMSIGVSYGIWSAVGVATIAVVGVRFLDDRRSLIQVSTEPGYAAAGLWEQVREVHPKTGLWPVLTKTDTWYRTGPERGWERPRELSIPELVADTDAADWLRERYRERSGDDYEIPRGGPDWAELDLELYDYDGFDWGDVWSIRGDCDEFDQLALVPAANSWLVPYELQWSGALK